MTISEPGYPQSHVDALLVQPETQAHIRDFFAAFDASREQERAQGLLVNTVQNELITAYPAVITENGLLFELYSTERPVDPIRDVPLSEATAEDVAQAALHAIHYDTKVKASLIDLNRSDPMTVDLRMFNTQWNKLDAVLQPGSMYAKGLGTLMLFGHQEDAAIRDPETALMNISKAAEGLSGDAVSKAQVQAMRELADQGTYFLLVNLHQYGDPDLNRRLAYTGGLKSEPFLTARKRIGFTL